MSGPSFCSSEGQVLTAYRVFFLDGLNRFTRCEIIEADTDDAAIVAGAALAQGAIQYEVWERDRCVATVTLDGPTSAQAISASGLPGQ